MLNYHEMTMDEPRDSPQKRKQFAVTCTIMAGVILYAVMTSGALLSVEPIQGKFPGGSYVYKYTARDYASSGGLGRAITQELIDTQVAQKKDIVPQYKLEEHVHHLFLDDPSAVGGSRQRYMSGILVSKSKRNDGDDESIDLLMGCNDETKRSEFTKDELHEMTAIEVFRMLPYETAELPMADALVLQFPWTGGISSMLVQTMKIIPKMHKLAAQKINSEQSPQQPPPQTVVISACSKEEQMCTHYAPLSNIEDFLLGRPTTQDFNHALGPEQMVNWYGMQLTLQYGADRIKGILGLGGTTKENGAGEKDESKNEEL